MLEELQKDLQFLLPLKIPKQNLTALTDQHSNLDYLTQVQSSGYQATLPPTMGSYAIPLAHYRVCKVVSVKRRLQTEGKMQTEGKIPG